MASVNGCMLAEKNAAAHTSSMVQTPQDVQSTNILVITYQMDGRPYIEKDMKDLRATQLIAKQCAQRFRSGTSYTP